MYIVFEYLAYVTLAVVAGAVLFGASATVLVTREGAKRVAATSRRLAGQAADLLAEYWNALRTWHRPNSQESG